MAPTTLFESNKTPNPESPDSPLQDPTATTSAMSESTSPPRVNLPSRVPMAASTAERIGQLRGIDPVAGSNATPTTFAAAAASTLRQAPASAPPQNTTSPTAPTYAWPYSGWSHKHKGAPVHFDVGATAERFDVHNSVLSRWSPLFRTDNGNPKLIRNTLKLPTVDRGTFQLLMNWTYQEKPLEFSTSSGLHELMKLWFACTALGMDTKANSILREATALMQPRHFSVGMETMRLVYSKTTPGAKIRKFIAAVFAQRSEVRDTHFDEENDGLGIWKDVTDFQNVMRQVARNPNVDWHIQDVPGQKNREGRVSYPVPQYLVFDKNLYKLPDELFITHEECKEYARDMMWQLGMQN